MIRLFRKIRVSLIESSQARKYLFYSIGEIALVVIGILIALQVNNWNVRRIEQEKESIYLRNIERDLKDQLTTIKLQVRYETSISEIATPIIEYYKMYQGFRIDSLFTINIGYLTGRKTFVKKTPTYTDLLSSGNIDIIRDNILKDQIIQYYLELERVELIINKNNNLYVDQVFIPQMIGLSEIQLLGEFSNPASTNPKPKMTLIDLNEKNLKRISKDILAKPEHELKLINCINYRNYITIIHLGILHELEEKTTRLLEQINDR